MRWLVCDVSIQFAFTVDLTVFQADGYCVGSRHPPSVAVRPRFSHMLSLWGDSTALVSNGFSRCHLTTFLVEGWISHTVVPVGQDWVEFKPQVC